MQNLTESDVAKFVENLYGPLKYHVLRHVRSSMSPHCRIVDCLAFCGHPSRGLELHGFEIKLSRNDWISELKNPPKAEEWWTYCNRWWLVVGSEDIVHPGELPPSWGLYVVKNNSLICVVEAAPLNPAELSRAMYLSLLAAFYGTYRTLNERHRELSSSATPQVSVRKASKKSTEPPPEIPTDLEQSFDRRIWGVAVFRNLAHSRWPEKLISFGPEEAGNLRNVLKLTSKQFGGGDYLVEVWWKRSRRTKQYSLPGEPIFTEQENKAQEDIEKYVQEVRQMSPEKAAWVEHHIAVNRGLLGSLLTLLGHKNITYSCHRDEPWPLPAYLLEMQEQAKKKMIRFLGLDAKPPDGMKVKIDF